MADKHLSFSSAVPTEMRIHSGKHVQRHSQRSFAVDGLLYRHGISAHEATCHLRMRSAKRRRMNSVMAWDEELMVASMPE